MSPIKIILQYFFATALVLIVCVTNKLLPVISDGTLFLIGFTPVCIVAWYCGRSCGMYASTLFIVIVNIMFMNAMNSEGRPSFKIPDLIKCVVYLIECIFLVMIIHHCRQTISNNLTTTALLNAQINSYISSSDTIPHMIWWAKHDQSSTSAIYLNRQWETYTGIKSETLIGNEWLKQNVIHEDDVAVLSPRWAKQRTLKVPYTYECRLRDSHGNYRTHLARVKPVNDSTGGIVMWVGTMTDIHEEKMAMERVAQADKRKDEFLAMLAHELRNPLAPIRNGLSLLQRVVGHTPDAARVMSMMDRQLGQLTRLIEDLMDVSRINQGKITLQPEPLDLIGVLSQAVDSVRANIEAKHQHIEAELSDSPVWVDGDRTRLAQVFTNLLTNASKYTEEGGHISVSVAVEVKEDKTATIKIKDDGTGIDPKVQPYIFDLFVQVDSNLARSQGGLGIGLTLVRRLVSMHGGKVSVKSDGIGKGSTFIVSLPLSMNVLAIDPNDKSGTKTALGCEPLTVVVADDNQDSTESIKLYLENEGHVVYIASDGREALDFIAQHRPNVAILDIGMPRLNGYEVARIVRDGNAYPGSESTMLIAATGYGQPNDKQTATMCGFDHHLTKPVNLNTLLSILATDQMTKKMGTNPTRQATRRPQDVHENV